MATAKKARRQKSRDRRVEYAREVVRAEADAVAAVAERLGPELGRAVELVLGCRGRVVVTGMGKPGFVAQKLSATLASTGTPSLYLHPAEALHGDLGRVLAEDVVVALSHSGETDEVLRLVQAVRALGAPVIALTGDGDNGLSHEADVVLEIGPVDEVCPMGLAPTASSIALLALADALAMTVLDEREFTPEAYARLHPGGALGRKLMKVAEIMRQGDACPVVRDTAAIHEAVAVMTRTPGRPGATTVVDGKRHLVGIFTDGDLRRLVEQGGYDFAEPIATVMGRRPRTVGPEAFVVDAAARLADAKVDQLPVVDEKGRVVGLLDVQDLLAAKLL